MSKEQNKKEFKQAPLPFVGQKRRFLNHFKQILQENIEGDGEGWTIIDVFGGSGLLAHTAKRKKPKARVIYNDFDDYSSRLKIIQDINRLRRMIFELVDGQVQRQTKINKELKAQIISTIEAFEGEKDFHCLSSWLLFSGKHAKNLQQLSTYDFWHCVRQEDYPESGSYLEGLEVVRESFHQLLPKFQGQENVLLLLDPPYICTRQDSYKNERFFDLVDFMRLIDLVRPPYLFFSSTKSEFIRFIHYMVEAKKEGWQNFEGAERIVINTNLNYQSQYEDNLVYKF